MTESSKSYFFYCFRDYCNYFKLILMYDDEKLCTHIFVYDVNRKKKPEII